MMLAGALVLASACAQKPVTAQGTTPGPQSSTSQAGRRGGDRMQALFTGITLSADQQSQIQAIRARHQADTQGLDPRNNPDDRAKMMQNMQTQIGEVRAILTPDQQTVFDQNVAEMRNRAQQRRGGPGRG
jgi:Spy/CpxP family protein refolding chaperone